MGMKTQFFCSVEHGDRFRWRVNETDLTFSQSDDIQTSSTSLPSATLYTLTVTSRAEYNYTYVVCEVQDESGDWMVKNDFTLIIRGTLKYKHI